jgi:RNA polymerase sigma-B factor
MSSLIRLDDRQLKAHTLAGDQRAREVLIERYLPLARACALRYRRTSEPVEDLFQVASLGLVKAVDGWEPERGFAFTTYAVPTILGELRRHLRDRTWAVRPPRRLAELAFDIEKAREGLTRAAGREPTRADFAAHLGRPADEVAEALHVGHGRWANALEGATEEPVAVGAPDGAYEHAEADATFDRLVAVLDPGAREIMRLRFDECLLQSQIAQHVGTSQMQVSRILKRSLDQLAQTVRQTAFGPQAV